MRVCVHLHLVIYMFIVYILLYMLLFYNIINYFFLLFFVGELDTVVVVVVVVVVVFCVQKHKKRDTNSKEALNVTGTPASSTGAKNGSHVGEPSGGGSA